MGIGPSTKETTLHHFRDPLLKVVGGDEDFDCLGVMLAGIPQDNVNKLRTGDRVGAWAEAMRADGVIVSADSWGNTNIDFAAAIEAIGKRDIPVMGITFAGTQGFIVENEYMDTIVDINKDQSGCETNVVGQNSMTERDARKAAMILKLKMRRHDNEKER